MNKLSIHLFNVCLLFVCLQLMSDNIRNTAQNVHRNADYIAVRGQFVLDNNHNYGFDDYTNWTFGSSDYYNEPQARKGKCSLPYISVQVQQRGYTKLELSPSPINSTVQIVVDDNFQYSPNNIDRTSTISFGPHNTSEATCMRAKSNDSEIAKIQLKCYDIKEIDLIVVNVNGNYSDPDFSCFFNQAILKVNKDNRQFNISELNVNNRNIIINNSTVWSLAMLNTLASNYRTMERVPQQTYVMFIINGILLENGAYQVLGYTESVPGYNCWILSATCQTRTPAHELGHCLGLGHHELDKDALMCQTLRARNDSSRKLRVNDWDVIR